MTNYREILRLQSLGLNKTEIAASLGCARNTVATALLHASSCGLQWPLPDEISEKISPKSCFPVRLGSRSTRCRITPTCTGKCKRAASL